MNKQVPLSVVFNLSHPYLPSLPPFAYAAFVTGILSCVTIHLYFDKLILKFRGFTWPQWTLLTTRTLLPHPIPRAPPHRPLAPRPSAIRSAPGHFNIHLLTLLASAQLASPFSLVSERLQYEKLQQYRCFQGQLDTTKLTLPDLQSLRSLLQLTSVDSVPESLDTTGQSFTAILDSGCSLTCTNNRKDFIIIITIYSIISMATLPSPYLLSLRRSFKHAPGTATLDKTRDTCIHHLVIEIVIELL